MKNKKSLDNEIKSVDWVELLNHQSAGNKKNLERSEIGKVIYHRT